MKAGCAKWMTILIISLYLGDFKYKIIKYAERDARAVQKWSSMSQQCVMIQEKHEAAEINQWEMCSVADRDNYGTNGQNTGSSNWEED